MKLEFDYLPNGARIIAINFSVDGGTVLAYREGREAPPYVVWNFKGGDLKTTGDASYFSKLLDAKEHFAKRIAELNLSL